jgi:hypothetical protein
MHELDAVIAVFADHGTAEAAVRKLTAAGFATETLSVVGKAYDREERVFGFYNTGGRIRFWGDRGAFWARMWSKFSGGLFVTVPVVGPVVVLGYLAQTAILAIEGAAASGGLNAVGTALDNIGIPRESAIQYEFAIKADGFLVMVHSAGAEALRARDDLARTDPVRLDLHAGRDSAEPACRLAAAAS